MPHARDSIVLRRIAWAAGALVLAGATAPAYAAKVYRCGNAFQDQPCATEKEGDTRPAATRTPAARDVNAPAAPSRTAAPSVATPIADRLAIDAPRSVAIEVRR